MKLHEFQCRFVREVLAETPPAAAAPGFRVHRNNTYLTLERVLRGVFPVTQRLVGEGFFRSMARAFIRAFPPACGNMLEYGAALPEFVEGYAPAASVLPLADVARLEWARQAAYHAADAPLLAVPALAAIPPERLADMRLALHPSCRIVRSRFPVLTLWQANQPEHAEVAEVDLAQGGQSVLVFRPRCEVLMTALSPSEAAFLEAAGEGFAQACEISGMDAGEALLRFVPLGVFSGAALPPPPR